MSESIIHVRGYEIDVDRLYREMWKHREVVDGATVFRGNARATPAIKRLLNELFGVPVKDTKEPTNAEARRAVADEMARLGWAEKVGRDNRPVVGTAARTSRFLLHRVP